MSAGEEGGAAASVIAVAARPRVSLERARAIARDVFGLDGSVSELGSNQDRNFRVDSPEGQFVLKIANESWHRDALAAQTAALERVAAATAGAVGIPAPRPALSGAMIVDVDVDDGSRLAARVLSFVPGEPLSRALYIAPVSVAALGGLAGTVSAALAAFDHAGLDAGPAQWNLEHGEAVVASLLERIPDVSRRGRVAALAAGASARLRSLGPSLRRQAIHGDVTDDNVTCARDAAGRLVPCGVIDFGDLVRAWAAAELAVTLTGVMRHAAALAPTVPVLPALVPAVRAFHAAAPLAPAGASSLGHAVV